MGGADSRLRLPALSLEYQLFSPLKEILKRAKACSPEDREADLVSADIAACNSRVREKAGVFILTEGLSGEDSRTLGFERFDSVQAALDEAFARIPGGTVGILPRGGVALPVLGETHA